MEHIAFVRNLVAVFGVSTLVVFLFRRLRQPTIVGFLASGVLVGPYGLSLIADVAQVELLAEIGVVLLLFTIGLEFSISKLDRQMVLWGGASRWWGPSCSFQQGRGFLACRGSRRSSSGSSSPCRVRPSCSRS